MRKLFLIIFLFGASVNSSWAAFDEYLTGGRATGLDGALTAASDDVYGLYYNPASTFDIKHPQVGTHYGRLYHGLSDDSNLSRSFIGYVYPSCKGALGLSYGALSLSDLYKEEVFGLSYANKIANRTNIGVTLKYLKKSIGGDFFSQNSLNPDTGVSAGGEDPVFNQGHNAGNISGDIGLTYKAGAKYTFGAMVMNVNEPNVVIHRGNDDRAPRIYKIGGARKWNGLLASFDISHGRFVTYETRVHGGLEKWWRDIFAVRVGGGAGERDYRRLNTGFSWRVGVFQLDYGFMMPFTTVKDTSGTHQFSVILFFGDPHKQESK